MPGRSLSSLWRSLFKLALEYLRLLASGHLRDSETEFGSELEARTALPSILPA